MAGAPTPHHRTASPQAVPSPAQSPLAQSPLASLSLVQQLQQVRDLAAAVLDSVPFSLLNEVDRIESDPRGERRAVWQEFLPNF